MDKRRDGRWAGHGIGKPNVEGDLGALATTAKKEHECDDGDNRSPDRQAGCHPSVSRAIDHIATRAEHIEIIERAELIEHRAHRHQKSEIANAVDDKSLFRGVVILVLVIPESD